MKVRSITKRNLIVLALTGGMLGVTVGAYAQNVTEEWVARFDGPANGNDSARALAVDGAGNVYVTGDIAVDPSRDYATIKYDTEGNELWVAQYDGPGNRQDIVGAIALDASGNFVYVTGESDAGFTFPDRTGKDYATIKYDAATGEQLWVARFDGGGKRGRPGDCPRSRRRRQCLRHR